MNPSFSTKILVVDANRANLHNIIRTLQDSGYSNVSASYSGEEAWNFLQRRYFDMLIVEWMLPALSGVELIERIRKHEAHRHGIIISSARRDLESVLQAVESGADAFMLKPFTDNVLLSKVAEVEARCSSERTGSK